MESRHVLFGWVIYIVVIRHVVVELKVYLIMTLINELTVNANNTTTTEDI